MELFTPYVAIGSEHAGTLPFTSLCFSSRSGTAIDQEWGQSEGTEQSLQELRCACI